MATAKRFVEEGAHVVITGRREKELKEAAAFIKGNIVIAHPGVGSGWVSSAVRRAPRTAVRLAFAVLTTERKAA